MMLHTIPMKTEEKTTASQEQLEEAFRIADEVREEVSRLSREERANLESAAHAVIRGARSARATCRAGH